MFRASEPTLEPPGGAWLSLAGADDGLLPDGGTGLKVTGMVANWLTAI